MKLIKLRKDLTLDIMVAIRNQVFYAEQAGKKTASLKNFGVTINRFNYYIRPNEGHKKEYEFALKAIEKEGYIKIDGETVRFVRYIFS